MNTHRARFNRHFTMVSAVAAGLSLALSLALSACSGGTSATQNPTPTPTAKTAVQVNMGDAPADWMLAFSMNISSMSLTGSNGSVTVVSSTVPMEMMHLMGVMQPLAMINAPQGTYTSASVTIGSANVMYMDPTTRQPVQETIPGPMTATVNFSSPMTLGTTPMAMSFDLDLANSVTGTAGGTLSMNPVFHFSSGMQGAGSPGDFANGGIQQMMGSVASVSGSSFAMNSMQAAQNFTFMTNGSTTFSGTSMSGMGNGMILLVDATLQPDGSLMATRVQSMMNSGGVMGGGIMTAVTGQPPTSLTMVMQNGTGTGMMSSAFGSGVTVNVSGGTTYTMDQDGVDMAGLPFTPVFDGSHIYAGQSVMPIGSSGMMSGGMGGGMMGGGPMAGTITATQVSLEMQGVSGTTSAAVTSGATSSFTLTLPTDCAFKTLTGAPTVTVFQQPTTIVGPTSPIASGSLVHVFGLLFYDGGQWKMVAARIGAI